MPKNSVSLFLSLVPLAGLVFVTNACTTSPPGDNIDSATGLPSVSARPPVRMIGELAEVEIPDEGELFIRSGHQIGGFDAIQIPMGDLNYQKGSPKLPPVAENEFMAQLEQSMADDARSRGFEVVDDPGACVLQMNVAIEDVKISRRREMQTTGDFATLTLAIELAESVSGKPLARYQKRERIISPGNGDNRIALIRANYAAILEEIDLPALITGVTAIASSPRPGCQGEIARIGRGEAG